MRSFIHLLVVASLGVTSPALRADDLPPVDSNFDANHCEFYVNSFGKEMWHYGGGGYDETVVVSYVSVNEIDLVRTQGGTIERVGALLNGEDAVFGLNIEPAYYQIRKSIYKSSFNGVETYVLDDFLYFIDVRRKTGEVDRLWLKNGASHFRWPSVLNDYPQHWVSLGSSAAVYAKEPSPIYNQKLACRR